MVGIPRLLRRLPHDVLRLRVRRTAPGKPPTGYIDLYADATGALAGVDDTGAALSIGGGGTPTSIANGGGSVAINGSGQITGTAPSGQDVRLFGNAGEAIRIVHGVGTVLNGSGDAYVQANNDDSAEIGGGPASAAKVSISAAGGVTVQPKSGEDLLLKNVPSSDPSVTDAVWSDGGVLVQSGATAPSPGLTRIAHIVGDGTTDTYSVALPATGDHLQLLAHFPVPGIEGPIGLGIGGSGAFAVAPLGTSVECQHIVEWPFFRDATEPMAVVTSMGTDGTFTTALFRGGPMADLDIEVFDAMAALTNLPTGAVIDLWVR